MHTTDFILTKIALFFYGQLANKFVIVYNEKSKHTVIILKED